MSYRPSAESPAPTLESLMTRYQQADAHAAACLVDRLAPQLHRFFLAQVFSRRHAQDLLQETWLRIHQARHTYRPGEPLLPWIYAIARHVRVDAYRRTRRHEQRERALDPAVEIASPAAAAAPDLETLLRALPDSQREVIVMLKITGMSLEEVARATSSSVGSVKQKAHRAYEKLRPILSGMGFGPSRTEKL